MGNNCTCLKSKGDIADLNLIHKNRTKILCKLPPSNNFFFNKYSKWFPKNNNELLVFSIIKIQSVFRGFNLRNKYSKNKSLFDSTFFKSTENLPYSSTKNNIITNEEIHNLFNNILK